MECNFIILSMSQLIYRTTMLQLLDVSQNSSSPYSVERRMQKTEFREQNLYQATQNLMILTECKRISKLLTFNVR